MKNLKWIMQISFVFVFAFILVSIFIIVYPYVERTQEDINALYAIPEDVENVSDIVRMKNGSIVLHETTSYVDSSRKNMENKDRIWINEIDKGWRLIPIESESKKFCSNYNYYFVNVIPDGRIGFACFARNISPASFAMFTYDLQSDRLTQLVPGLLPDAGAFSWSSDMSLGILSTRHQLGTLYWIDGAGIRPVDITIKDGGKSWYLPDSELARQRVLASPPGYRWPNTIGEVGSISWSPVSERIAFWATLVPVGGSPVGFRNVSWNLYLLDRDSMSVNKVISNAINPDNVVWSPDGEWIAYYNNGGFLNKRGIWLYSMKSGESKFVYRTDYTRLAWSSDGKSIITTICSDENCGGHTVWQYDVSSIVAQP